jgi:hypothetical protein
LFSSFSGNKFTGTVPSELCAKNLNSVFFQGTPVEIRGGDSDFDDDFKATNDDETYDEDVLSMEEKDQINGVSASNEDDDGLIMNGTSVPVRYTGDGTRHQRILQKSDESINSVRGGEKVQPDLKSAGASSEQCSDEGCTRNGCNSVACPAGYESTSMSKNGVFPCRKCHHDFINPYIGASRCFVVDQHEILTSFYNATNGENWYGEHESWTSDTVPVCKWSGIACNNNKDIISIVLPNTNLHGTIIPNLGFLRHLEVVDVSDNFLTGEIPAELHYAPLEVLDVSGNALVGVVPPMLCEKEGVNNNGNGGVFSCQKIACSVGTYSTTGRGGGKDGTCVSCDKSAQFLGMKACAAAFVPKQSSNSSKSPQSKAGAIFAVVFLSVLGQIFMCGAFYLFRRRQKMMREVYDMHEADDFEDPEVDDDFTTASFASSNETPQQNHPSDLGSINDLEPDLPLMAIPSSQSSRSAWINVKEQQSEVWLDVPKIS